MRLWSNYSWSHSRNSRKNFKKEKWEIDLLIVRPWDENLCASWIFKPNSRNSKWRWEREREIVLPMQVNFLVDGAERKMIPKTNRKVSSELFVFCIHWTHQQDKISRKHLEENEIATAWREILDDQGESRQMVLVIVLGTSEVFVPEEDSKGSQ